LTAKSRVMTLALAVLSVSTGLLAPSTAIAASGGSGLGPAPGTSSKSQPPARGSSTQSNPLGDGEAASGTVTASGNGISITSRAFAMLRQQLRFTGTVPATAAGQVIELQRRGSQTGWAWANTAHATAGGGGSFTIVWYTNHIGRFQFRAVIGLASAARAGSASPSVTAIVYRPSIASWYGPGMFGTVTACGVKLRKGTLGVANRTLPCGTEVAFYFQGRTLIVPVIDRGPYANNADWDLTEATANKLGFADVGVGTVGAVPLPS